MVAIGIDLGTTCSCIARLETDEAEVHKVKTIPNTQGGATTPSCVSFFYDARPYVGQKALERRGTDALSTVYEVKRLMGKRITDHDISKQHIKFEICADNQKAVQIRVGYRKEKTSIKLYPEEVCSEILYYLKESAEKFIQEPVKDVVITVPSNFNDAQREATKDAGVIAGFNVLQILNEPTAAAIAYAFDLHRNHTGKLNVLVYDFGGGTFDVSVVEVEGLMAEVKSTSGKQYLGGIDIDRRIFDDFVSYNNEKWSRVSDDAAVQWTLLRKCEVLKIELSTCESASFTIEIGGDSVEYTLSRGTLIEMCNDIIEQTINCLEESLRKARMKKDDIHEVVLVGGSARLHQVKVKMIELFGAKKIRTNINPDEAIAHGAAIIADTLVKKQNQKYGLVELQDITPFDLGVAIAGDKFDVIIPAGTKIPCEATKKYQNAEDNQNSILIKVYEGSNEYIYDNHFLAHFSIPIKPMPKSKNKIEETFRIDTNGLLRITAREQATDSKHSATVKKEKFRAGKLSQMVVDAQLRRDDWQEADKRKSEEEQLRRLVPKLPREKGDELARKIMEHKSSNSEALALLHSEFIALVISSPVSSPRVVANTMSH